MWTIIDAVSGLVLFAKYDNECLEGQIAIEKVCTIETEGEIFYNFETHEFYTKE
jgi:hypothetical protein